MLRPSCDAEISAAVRAAATIGRVDTATWRLKPLLKQFDRALPESWPMPRTLVGTPIKILPD
jgi:hypothetical protein